MYGNVFSTVVHLSGLIDTTTLLNTTALRLVFNALNGINQKDNPSNREIVHLNTSFFDNLKMFPDNVGEYFSTVVYLSGLIDTTTLLNTTTLRLVFNALNGINIQFFDNLKIFSDNVGEYFSTVVHSPGLVKATLFTATAMRLASDCSMGNLQNILNTTVSHLIFYCSANNFSILLVVHSPGMG